MALKLTRLGWTSNIDPTVLDANFQKVATAFDRLMTATNGFVGTYIYEQDKVEVTIHPGNNQIRLTNPKNTVNGPVINTADSEGITTMTPTQLDIPLVNETLDLPKGYKAILMSCYVQKSTRHNMYIQCLGINYVNIYNAENSDITCQLTPRWLIYKSISTSTEQIEAATSTDLESMIDRVEAADMYHFRQDD